MRQQQHGSEHELGTLAACSVLSAALLVATPALGWGLCDIDQPIRVTYPDASGGGSIPRNAALLVVVDGMVDHVALIWPDRSVSRAAEQGLGRFLHDAGGRLTPGTHELTLQLEMGSSLARSLDPDTFTLRFDVADAVAPAPDETSRVAITRLVRFAHRIGGRVLADKRPIEAALADPTDCSAEVGAQGSAWCRDAPGPAQRVGELRVELEGEGALLGYAINDRIFLPAYCRSAFFRNEDAPFSVRPITETGAGSAQEYLGEIEVEVSPEPDPWPVATAGGACSIGTPGGAASRPVRLWVVLLASAFVARRRRAWGILRRASRD
jgi:hypothetical protein